MEHFGMEQLRRSTGETGFWKKVLLHMYRARREFEARVYGVIHLRQHGWYRLLDVRPAHPESPLG